jgi:hypothetical protein
MSGRCTVFATVILGLLAASCRSQSSTPAGTGATAATASTSAGTGSVAGAKPKACSRSHVTGFNCTHPSVTVTPSDELRNGQRVTVRVTGFAVGGKVFLSECATSAAANALGCGSQLAAQWFLVTGNNRAGSGTFTVSGRASAGPGSSAGTRRCAYRCVIVATLGGGLSGDYAHARIFFAR